MLNRLSVNAAVVAFVFLMPAVAAERPPNAFQAQGTFKPSGPPDHPARHEIADICIVDLDQSYEIDGTFTGTMTVDFRIFVDGPCGSPPGTFNEHWIAHGQFDLASPGAASAKGSLAYLADVAAGDRVTGTITLAGELQGTLRIKGSFQEGAMNYMGSIAQPAKD